MRKEVFFITALFLILIPFVSSPFGYNNPNLPHLEKIEEYINKEGDSATGTFKFNGGWMNNGLSIIDGNIYAQVGYFYNITSLNVTKQNLKIIENLDVLKNLTVDTNTLFVDAGNNKVGIGTTTPDYPLDVVGEIKIAEADGSGDSIIIQPATDGNTFFLAYGAGAGEGGFRFKTNDGAVDTLAITQDGNVGIGTTNVLSKLHVYESDYTTGGDLDIATFRRQYNIGGSSAGLIVYVDDGGTSGWVKMKATGSSSQNLGIGQTGEELVIRKEAGNVGIGTTSPDRKMHIKDASDSALLIHSLNSTAGSFSALRFKSELQDAAGRQKGAIMFERTGSYGVGKLHLANNILATNADAGLSDAKLTVAETGNVGIGTITPTHKLNVVGNANFTGNIIAENVHLPAYVSSHTNDTIAVASAGVWYNVTFDHEVDEFKKRITHTTTDATNTTFTIQDTGIYEITYTMSFQDSAVVPNSHVVTRVTNNNVELNGFTIEEDFGIQDQDKSLHHSDLVELTVGDEIVLSFTSDDTTVSLTSHLTYGIHRNTAHLTIKRIA